MKPMLPPVDPEYLLIERNPERLRAYARALLQHVQNVRAKTSSGKSRRSSSRYPIGAAACWLIGAYANAKVAPAPEAARLIEEIIRPNRQASTLPVLKSNENAYWEAIRFEANHAPDNTGKNPSGASGYAVAAHILKTVGIPKIGKRKRRSREFRNNNADQKAAASMVRGWRKLHHYQANVAFQRPARLRVKI